MFFFYRNLSETNSVIPGGEEYYMRLTKIDCMVAANGSIVAWWASNMTYDEGQKEG
jgi:hypothetical protein